MIKKFGLAFLIIVAAIALIVGAFKVGSWYSGRDITALKLQLAKSEETTELATQLYVRKLQDMEKLDVLLNTEREEVKRLKKFLDETDAKLLATQQIALKWKKAYEAVLDANQTDGPPDEGGVTRKRVDFAGNIGPLHASGHTLTDPAEAFLKFEQIVPLVLTVAVAQNKDKTWSTYVTSSDENVDVKINLAGVNPLVLSPKWYQRFWWDTHLYGLGDTGVSAGLSWRGDNAAFGVSCAAVGDGKACGVNFGLRLGRP